LSNYNTEVLAITRRDEFESKLFYTNLPNVSYSAEPIGSNQFHYSADINRLHVKKDNTRCGQTSFYIPSLRIGDKVLVEFEYLIVSPLETNGIIRVSFNEIESNDPNKTPILMSYYDAPHNNGEYKKSTVSYMVTNTNHKNLLVDIGMPWWKTGEVYIRDLRVVVQRSIPLLLDSIKGCMIRKNSGVWEIRSDFYGSDIGTITVKDVTTLSITFKNPFQNRPVATANSDSAVLSGKYRPCVGLLTQLGCDIKFIKNDNTFANLADIEESAHFSFIFLGSERL